MIARKKKVCISCQTERYIYAKKMCRFCYQKYKPPKAIPKRSKKSEGILRQYNSIRNEFLEENPVCMYPGCNSREVTLHHARGRSGSLLTDKRYFKSLCWPHHQHIEQNPDLAKKLGLSYYRLSNN